MLVLGILVVLGLAARSLFGSANRPVFLVAILIILLLMSGLRHESVGTDAVHYKDIFTSFIGTEYSSVESMISMQKEPVFYMFAWGFARLIPDVHVWFAFVSLVYLIGIALVCYWESPDYPFSILYVFCMGMFFFSLTGLRQSLAMGIVLCSYYFMVKRKLIPFLLLVFLASRFHRTAWIVLAVYPIVQLKAGWPRMLIGLAAFIIVLAFRDRIGTWMLNAIPSQFVDSRISNFASRTERLTASGFIIKSAMLVFCLRYRKLVVEDVPHREALYNLASVGLLFQAASISIAEFFRFALYFDWSYMVLIPICIQYEDGEKSYEFLRIVLMTAFIAYFFYSTISSYGVTPYMFFWAKPLIG